MATHRPQPQTHGLCPKRTPTTVDDTPAAEPAGVLVFRPLTALHTTLRAITHAHAMLGEAMTRRHALTALRTLATAAALLPPLVTAVRGLTKRKGKP